MGPFEIAPGTQFDDEPDFEHGMFPPKSHYPPLRGAGGPQIPAARRHLGPLGADHPPRHPQRSQMPRPVLVLGVDAPDAGNGDKHDMAVTRGYWASLPEQVSGTCTARWWTS